MSHINCKYLKGLPRYYLRYMNTAMGAAICFFCMQCMDWCAHLLSAAAGFTGIAVINE